jgi:hypothetical protein
MATHPRNGRPHCPSAGVRLDPLVVDSVGGRPPPACGRNLEYGASAVFPCGETPRRSAPAGPRTRTTRLLFRLCAVCISNTVHPSPDNSFRTVDLRGVPAFRLVGQLRPHGRRRTRRTPSRPPSPARFASVNTPRFVAGEGRGWGWRNNELSSLCWHVTAINHTPPNPGGRPQPGVRRVRRLPMRGHPRADPHWRDPAHERFSLAESSFSVGPTHPDLGQHRFARGPGLSARGPTPAAWKTADAPYSKFGRSRAKARPCSSFAFGAAAWEVSVSTPIQPRQARGL